jgi:hypothetical protein
MPTADLRGKQYGCGALITLNRLLEQIYQKPAKSAVVFEFGAQYPGIAIRTRVVGRLQ